MVDSARGPWNPHHILISGVKEFIQLRKDGLIPGVDTATPLELQIRARASAAYTLRIIRLLMQGRLGELHR